MIVRDIHQFLASPARNAWLRHRNLNYYARKSVRLIDGRRVCALDRANTSSTRRDRKTEADPTVKRTGQYKELDDLMKGAAVAHAFNGVYVENVINDFLPAKLESWGYRHVGDGCYWWQP